MPSLFGFSGVALALCACSALADEGVISTPPQDLSWRLTTGMQAKAEGEVDALSAMVAAPKARVAAQANMQTSEGAASFFARIPLNTVGSAVWKAPIDLPEGFYAKAVRIEFAAEGLKRPVKPDGVISVTGQTASGEKSSVDIIDSAQVLGGTESASYLYQFSESLRVDNIVVKLSPAMLHASLELSGLQFMNEAGLAASTYGKAGATFDASLKPVVFNQPLQTSLRDFFTQAYHFKGQPRIDAAQAFASSDITVEGLPFQVTEGEKQLLLTRADKSPLQVKDDFYGYELTRGVFFTPSREDRVTVEVGQPVSEVYMLIAAEFNAVASRYGLGDIPTTISDVEWVAVELEYEDGTRDLAFPYSLKDKGFVIWRTFGAYAVPVDMSRKLKAVHLRTRQYDLEAGLAAVTVNVSPEQRLASVWHPPAPVVPKRWPAPAEKAPYLGKTNDGFVLGNRFYDVSVQLGQEFGMEILRQHWNPDASLQGKVGLACRIGQKTLASGDFNVTSARSEGTTVRVTLAPKDDTVPVRLHLTIEANATPALSLDCKVENTGKDKLSIELVFPVVDTVVVDSLEDTWLFFPQYRNVITNQPGNFVAWNDSAFPVQFLSIYNPGAGVGLGLLTHNSVGESYQYRAGKDTSGCSAAVAVMAEYFSLDAETSHELPAVSLLFHDGDWKQAMKAYKGWLNAVTKPQHATNREWFDAAGYVSSYVSTPKEALRIMRLPSYIDWDTKQFRIDDFLDMDERYFGRKPGFAHLFAWHYDVENEHYDWGDYDDAETYERLGGVGNFHDNVTKIQQERNTPLSLYTIPDRFNTGTAAEAEHPEFIAAFSEKGDIHRAGVNLVLTDTLNPNWLKWYVDSMVSLQKKTGAQAIYVDVFPYHMKRRAWVKGEGGEYERISSYISSIELAHELRESLPSDVVLWSEYAPQDIVGQWMDGYISYIYLHLNEHFTETAEIHGPGPLTAPLCFSIYRFTSPALKVFFFPVGEGPGGRFISEMKQPLFNGDAYYSTGYHLFPERPRQFVSKAIAILQDYADCFNAADPEPLIDSLQAGVYVNRFPGNNRVLYTVYNASFLTVDDGLFRIPHVEGATYHDLWEEKEMDVTIENDYAVLASKINPQDVRCFLQKLPGE